MQHRHSRAAEALCAVPVEPRENPSSEPGDQNSRVLRAPKWNLPAATRLVHGLQLENLARQPEVLGVLRRHRDSTNPQLLRLCSCNGMAGNPYMTRASCWLGLESRSARDRISKAKSPWQRPPPRSPAPKPPLGQPARAQPREDEASSRNLRLHASMFLTAASAACGWKMCDSELLSVLDSLSLESH